MTTTTKRKRGRPKSTAAHHLNVNGNALPPSRAGRVMIAGHFYPAVHLELKILALREGKTLNSILAEAITDLFAKYGRPSVEQLEKANES
jgi:hypothetical protein